VTPSLVLRQAETELLDARDWYEDQRPGLGDAFATEVGRAVSGILQARLAYPRVQGEIRRALLPRFPYAIYFRATPDEIAVLAVLHGRGILNDGSRGADVEPRSRADRSSRSLARGCSPRRSSPGGARWARLRRSGAFGGKSAPLTVAWPWKV